MPDNLSYQAQHQPSSVRRRISRACDQCNQLRTRCDGMQPCAHCKDCHLTCEYRRLRKKRGKASRKDSILSPTAISPIICPHPRSVPSVGQPLHIHPHTASPTSSRTSTASPTYLEHHHISNVSPFMSGIPGLGEPASDYTLMTPPSPAIKYPILEPVLAQLHFLPANVASDLLETYFSDLNPYVLAHCLRKRNCLARTPGTQRRTTPALLFAILCVAAHTCNHPYLTNTPVSRARLVQRLFELCLISLRPLQHDEICGGGLDDVICYIQISVMIAASEFKGVSLRWFHSGISLARELRFNCETVDNSISQDEREERRRSWWLLYAMDRHLALCYNRTMAITDVETAGLYQPCDEFHWNSNEDLPVPPSDHPHGPYFLVRGSDIFGFFLPLMSILGQVVILHEIYQSITLNFGDLGHLKVQIVQKLESYRISLENWRYDGTFRMYALQIWHAIYILISGKWDVIEMIKDTDGWISSEEFVTATAQAVSAAHAVNHILQIDPDLTLMPWFFGIYLLQGSFLILLIVDKLGPSASPAVLEACEIIIRAHESCVVTLDTQYQRNFRKVMRTALHEATTEQVEFEAKSGKLEVLKLYRWCGDGRGLVV